mmetsp:Transcript_7705/g.16492  ORF Transcript_7705/g.16492 Transcript_7705/m.16492 type:complete len:329 (-) Transcript_7705:246-1232(-)|eukprot:CAMPEP_0171346816 /NCGR_PEP_ID=MMETSP0878-20121228/26067_1 /TAXON_ID=67004 /ORGANISM="Thalassiosira weissflogii, Strain CCMP1336" /LENGTH=328 /DNA_ID=CAMNT_0011850639 /DNA_START=34 /DNA_END=1020 /DNA_ORIENTATION=-
MSLQPSRWGDRHPSASRPTSNQNASYSPDVDDESLAMAALLNDANAHMERARQSHDKSRNPRNRDHHPQGENGRRNDRPNNLPSGDRRNHEGKRVVEDDESTDRNKRRRHRWNDAKGEHHVDRACDRPAHEGNDTSEPSDDYNPNKVKADFGLSGALAKDTQTGNVVNGITLKFSEPPEARVPNTRWRLYVFRRKNSQARTSVKTSENGKKDGDLIDIYHISRQSAYLFGRERKVADIPVDHPSLSKQHAVLQFRALSNKNLQQMGVAEKLQCKPYLMDLESTNGTFINGVRLDSARYYELRRGDVITLGGSTREYVLLTEQSAKTGL